MNDFAALRAKYEQHGNEDVRPTSDLLPWMFLHGDRLVVNKDSGVLASWALRGLDSESMLDDEVNGWAGTLERALAQSFSAWPVTHWWTVHRRRDPSPPTNLAAHPVVARLDANLRDNANRRSGQFTNRHYYSMLGEAIANRMAWADRIGHYYHQTGSMPKALLYAAQNKLFQDRTFAYLAGELDTTSERFEDIAAGFMSNLNDLGPVRLTDESLLGFLHACASPANPHQSRVALPPGGFLDTWLADSYYKPYARTLQVLGTEQRYIAAIGIKGWPRRPDGLRPKMLESLLRLPIEMTVSLCWRMVAIDQSIDMLKRREKFFEITQHSLMSYVAAAFRKNKDDDGDAAGKLKGVRAKADKEMGTTALDEQIQAVQRNERAMGYANLTILIHAETAERLNDHVKMVEAVLRLAKLTPMRESTHTLSAFSGTLPGQWGEIVRWAELDNRQIADLAPIHAALPGDRTNGYLTEQTGTPHYALIQFMTQLGIWLNFNFHVGDLGHALLVGKSRGGKTALVNLLTALWLKYPRANVLRLDFDRSCRITTLLTGGQWIDTRSGKARTNPMRLLQDRRHWRFLAEWLLDLAGTFGYKINATADITTIYKAMEYVATLEDPENDLRLLSLWQHIPAGPLKEALRPWVEQGAYADLYDNVEDDFAFSSTLNLCIEMKGIYKSAAAESYLSLLLYRIEDKLSLDASQAEKAGVARAPTIIYIEEGGVLLKSPWFARQADDMLKRLGKLLTSLIITVQSPEDIPPPLSPSIRDNIATYIYLPNRKAATSEKLRNLYASEFGLNEKQLTQIATAVRKRDYLIVQEDISRLVSTDWTPDTLAHIRSDKLAQDIFDAHWSNGRGSPGWEQAYIDALVTAGEIPDEEEEDELY